ncbi:MAG: hypothetical protein ACI83O_000095 [Patescibacteria group bacterium]|jgi:hypothetical protein
MKKVIIILIVILILIITLILFIRSTSDNQTITIEVVRRDFGFKDPSQKSQVTTTELILKEGDTFLTSKYTGDEKLFSIKEIISNNKSIITISKHLSKINESIESAPSEKAIITQKQICFLTQTYDAGESICLKIKSQNSNR